MEQEVKEEFVKVRSEFSEYQKDFEKRLDDLFERLSRPMFTNVQIITAIVAMIVYTFYITDHISTVRQVGESNSKIIEKQEVQIKEDRQANSDKIDKIYEVVLQTKEDVAILKKKKTEYVNRKSEIETNKQIVRDFASGNSTK